MYNKRYVDPQWRKRYNQSIIDNPLVEEHKPDKEMMEYVRRRQNSLLFPLK